LSDKKKNLKEVLVNHFDKQDIDSFKNFGSSSFAKSWQEPYKYLENYLRKKNLHNKSLLDYCCGTGVHSIFPAKLGAKITGTDFSPASLNVAKKRANFFQVESECKFILQDAQDKEALKDKFDFAICVQSLLYLDLDDTFKRLSKLLKENGELIIIESVSGNFFFDLNRKRNTKKISSTFSNSLNKYSAIEIIETSKKYFHISKEEYFGLTTSLSYILEKKLKITFLINILIFFDFILKKIPFFRKFFFTTLIVLRKN
tara:strand:+ start:44293 stop:45066 length:774 start_codon:yes stop_codon:yes gene_type:complete